MSRTELHLVPMPVDRLVHAAPHQTIDATHGMVIPLEGASSFYLEVSNSGTGALTVVLRDGDPSVSSASGGGDESVQIPAGEERFLGPFSASRFTQTGGLVWLDFGSAAAGRIAALRPA
jgi:hypothetical protein